MMLLERWVVAGVLGIGIIPALMLASNAGPASTAVSPAQDAGSTNTPAKAQSKHAKQQTGQATGKNPPDEVVQPDNGAPPDEAVRPDQTAPLAPARDHDPPPPPPDPLPETAAEPAKAPEKDAAPSTAAQDSGPATPQQKTPTPAPAASASVPHVDTEPLPANATPEQRQLRRDANRLLQLAGELKAEVEKAGTNTLSLAALRKADEMRRLSIDLKERMKGWSETTQNR